VVNIEDVNDNAPIFLQSKYEARLWENHMEFESPLYIEAVDLDLNGEIYSLRKNWNIITAALSHLQHECQPTFWGEHGTSIFRVEGYTKQETSKVQATKTPIL
jgi:hypothetical protein